MKLFHHTLTVRTSTVVLLLVAMVGYQALAQRSAGPRSPVIATVQIEVLFDGLQERAEAKAEVTNMESDIAAEEARRQASIEDLEAELEDVVAAARREALQDKIALERMRLQFWQQAANSELEVEKALRLQHLYDSLKAAIEELARDEGYDMVIVNDAADELPFDRESRVPAQMQVLQQITSRKLLYLNDAIDITQDLIVRMNNKFRAAP